MANRRSDRYTLPEVLGNENMGHRWFSDMPFWLGCAIKYTYRGWDDAEDIDKAINSLERSIEVELGCVIAYQMSDDLQSHTWPENGRMAALGLLFDNKFITIFNINKKSLLKVLKTRLEHLKASRR